jgi:hypothetical protein
MNTIYFFLDSFIYSRVFKHASTEVLTCSYWAVETLGDMGTYSPPTEASPQGLKCTTNNKKAKKSPEDVSMPP